MEKRSKISSVLILLLTWTGSLALSVPTTNLEERHPVVGNWTHAKWFTGLVKIPTHSQDDQIWPGNLIAGGDGQYDDLICTFDNNFAGVMILNDGANGTLADSLLTNHDLQCSEEIVTVDAKEGKSI